MKTDDEGVLQRPQLIWDAAAGCFRIRVQKRKPTANSTIEAGFDEDLDAFFGNRSSPPPPFPTEIRPSSLSPKMIERLATAKSAILIYFSLLGLSPILKSLTESTSIDSIWALSSWLMCINVFTFDYGAGPEAK